MSNIKEIVERQKKNFIENNNSDLDSRLENLNKLRSIIEKNEKLILASLNEDLKKSEFEGYLTEISMVYEEINTHIKHLKKWMKRECVKTPISHFPAKSYIYKEPYGVVLIIGPFNYPFQLVMSPLVGAISAGNCAVIKPSEHAQSTGKLIEKLINENFDEEYIKVVNPLGGKEVVEELLDCRFDYIFFTGSIRVGKIIMKKAAENLIPVTLELGGKSPCIVDLEANLKMAAKRIVWGKFLNAGQTCVAPDYVLVQSEMKDKFLELLRDEIILQFGENRFESMDFARIVNKDSFDRIKRYLDEGRVYFGGDTKEESLYIEPTILTNIKDKSKILDEEIFGPILPVFTFHNLEEVISDLKHKEKPLALYYFSEAREKIEYVLSNTTSGGVTINDTIIHVASPYLPFGGVGNSGVGTYHGKGTFDTFTHRKSVVKRSTLLELPLRFAPFGDKIKIIKKLMS